MGSEPSAALNRIVTSVTRVALGCIVALAIFSFLGCGEQEEELLPGDTAEEILTNLDSVEQLAADGACDEAIASIEEVRQQVEGLPPDVSDRLRNNLMHGVTRLREVTEESCGTDSEAQEATSETDATDEDPKSEPSSTEEPGQDDRDAGNHGSERGKQRSGTGNSGGEDDPEGDGGIPGQGPDRSPSEDPTGPETPGGGPTQGEGGTSGPEATTPEQPASGGVSPGQPESGREGSQ